MFDSTQDSISFLIVQICKAHRSSAEASLSDLGLHVGQEMCLMQLWQQDGLTQTQLAEKMCVQPPTLHKMLSRMETSGLIERRTDDEDNRVSRVYLTDASRALSEATCAVWESLEARTTAGMTLDERVLLRRLLMQVQANLTTPK